MLALGRYTAIITCLLWTVSSYGVKDARGILYWENNEQDGRVQLKVYLPNQKRSVLIATLESKPMHFYLSKDAKNFYVILNEDLYQMEWKVGAKPKRLFRFPRVNLAEFYSVWVDKKSGNWRNAYVDEYPPSREIIEKTINGKKEEYVKHENDVVKIDDPHYKNLLGVAVVKEYQKDKGWVVLDKKTTTCNAQSDPCLGVIYSHIDKGIVFSDRELRKRMYDNTQQMRQYQIGYKVDGMMTYRIQPYNGRLIRINSKDSYFFPPLKVVLEKTEETIELIRKQKGRMNLASFIGFEQYKHYLLVARTARAFEGRLFNLMTGETEFVTPVNSPVTWISSPRL